MDTFNGQENNTQRELCQKNTCELVIVPNNLTDKFKLLTVNKAVKHCIKYARIQVFTDPYSPKENTGQCKPVFSHISCSETPCSE